MNEQEKLIILAIVATISYLVLGEKHFQVYTVMPILAITTYILNKSGKA